MSGLFLLANRTIGRPAIGTPAAPSNPGTVNPADYGTALGWFDPSAGPGVGYTLDGGSKVATLIDRAGVMGSFTPYVAASGPAIATVGAFSAARFLAASETRLRWTGTARTIRGFALVFRVATDGVGISDELLQTEGGDAILQTEGGDAILISPCAAFIMGWLGENLGVALGEISDATLREIVTFRGGGGDADPATYRQVIDQTGASIDDGVTYLLAGRWTGARWEIYLNSTYDRANGVSGSVTTFPTTATLMLGGCLGTQQAQAGIDLIQAGFFSVAPPITQFRNYLTALGTAYSATLATAAPSPAEVVDQATTVADLSTVRIDLLNGAAAGTNAIDATTVTITSQPSKGRVQVTDGGIAFYTATDSQTTDSFSFIVRDAAGLPSNEATISVTIGTVSAGSAEPYEDLGFGNATAGVNLYPHTLDEANQRHGMAMRCVYAGAVEAAGFNLSSNQPGEGAPDATNTKSRGTGVMPVRVTLCRGQAKGAGDGGNFSSKPDFSKVLIEQFVNHNLGDGDGGAGAYRRRWHKLTSVQEFYAYPSAAANVVADTLFFLSWDPVDSPQLEPVRFATTGTLPAPLATGTDYWLKRQSTGVAKVASSYANAQAGTFIDLTTAGSGLHSLQHSVTADAGTDILTFKHLCPGHLAKVQFTTTGGLPGGLSTSTDYWLIRLTATTAKVASSRANAIAGTAIDISSAGTGVHQAQQEVEVEVGEHLHLVAWPQATAPATNYLCINQPAYRTGSTISNIPFGWTPARHFGPYYGNDNAYVLSENGTTFSETWTRDTHMYGFFDLHYADGETIGPGYWLTGNVTRENTYVGRLGSATVNRRVRQRWRQVLGNKTIRYVWVWCFWKTGFQPDDPLVLTLNRINSIGPSETRTQLAQVSLSPVSGNTTPDDINDWSFAQPVTGVGDWCRFDLGSAGVALTDGEDYEILFTTAETEAGKIYRIFMTESNVARQTGYDIEVSRLNIWRSRAGQSNAQTPSYAEITDTAGDTGWAQPPEAGNVTLAQSGALSVWFEYL